MHCTGGPPFDFYSEERNLCIYIKIFTYKKCTNTSSMHAYCKFVQNMKLKFQIHFVYMLLDVYDVDVLSNLFSIVSTGIFHDIHV